MLLKRLLLTMTLAVCTAGHAADVFVYTVQSGDHPWNIALRYLKDTSYATRLVRLNKIVNDRTVAPGTELHIPAEWLRLQSTRVHLVAAQGEATLFSVNGTRSAQSGDELLPGYRLRTGPKASALLEFEDGSRVMLRQTSELRLTRAEQRLLDGGKLVEIELLRGGLENIIKPSRGPATRFEIRSPSAVAAVRGTTFRVNATDDATWTEVLEGGVEVSNMAGAAQAGAGFGTVARLGRAPDPPKPLLPAADISNLPQRLERLPINYPLPEVPGAVGYRTQIAPDNRFETIVSDEATERPRARAMDVPDGQYVLRVRAIDAQGLEGLSNERAIEVYARPEPPLLIAPELGSQTTSLRPVFRWTQANMSWNYRLEIHPEAGITGGAPLHAQTIVASGQTELGVDLAPGEYRWRMASIIPSSGRQGPWGDPQPFRRVLPSPALESPVVLDGGTSVRWSALPHARAYVLQLARDNATFEPPLFEGRSEVPQFQLQNLAPGVYQIRLQAIATDGFAGPWGLPQQFTIPEPPPPPPPPPAPEPEHWRALLLVLPVLLLFGL